jgi:hypothetical protein
MAMISDWIVALVASRAAESSHLPLKVAVVGSALGLEIRDACARIAQQQRRRLHAVLLDLDPEGIDVAKNHLAPLLREEQISAAAMNVFRLPDRPNSAPELRDCNLIVCPGLFDYLGDDAAINMLRVLYERVAAGGQLTVFQFAPHNPSRAYMEWFGNWYLIYRTPEDFQRLVQSANLAGVTVDFGAEPLGIDLYASICRSFGSG